MRAAPLAVKGAPELGEHEFEHADDDRNGDKDDQRQLPVHDEQENGNADEFDHVDDQLRYAVNIEGTNADGKTTYTFSIAAKDFSSAMEIYIADIAEEKTIVVESLF